MPQTELGLHVPQSVAFIPDGNRRHIKEQDPSQPVWVGHEIGARTIRPLVECALQINETHERGRGITHMSFWGASPTNLTGRDGDEAGNLTRIFKKVMKEETGDLIEAGARIRFVGSLGYDQELADMAGAVVLQSEATNPDPKITVVFAINYDGASDAEQASEKVYQAALQGEPRRPFREYLWTAGLPDIDLMIRTGGDRRISGAFPLEAANAELDFLEEEEQQPVYWPQYTPDHFRRSLERYGKRERRFGK